MSRFEHILWYDTETFSWENLKTAGTYRYAEQAEIIVAQYALDDGPVHTIDCFDTRKPPAELREMLEAPEVQVRAHNASFDRTLTRMVWSVDPSIDRWYCTAAQARAHGLPGGLDRICQILQLDEVDSKHQLDRAIMLLFCTPRPKNWKLKRATPDTHPEQWQEFLTYAGQDVVAMRAASKKMPDWNYRTDSVEHRLWQLDQLINDRGFAIDTEFAQAAIKCIKRLQKQINAQVEEETDGAVATSGQRDAILAYILEEHGVTLPDMRADTLRRRLEDPELPESVKILINLRLEGSKTSTAKYNAAIKSVSSDGRFRGGLIFAGAIRTGRWSGARVQPQNFARPPKYLEEQRSFEDAVESVMHDCPELFYENPMEVLSGVLRGIIVADKGKKLIPSDWANIEGRSLPWLAGEQWKLQAFRDFDEGIGPDLYIASYSRSFSVDPDDVDTRGRQIGKVQELALGYQGGIGAFLTFAAVYRIDLQELAEIIFKNTTSEEWDEAVGFVDWLEEQGHALPIDKFVAIACQVIKARWRSAHPMIEKFWSQLDNAFRNAITTPGTVFRAGKHIRIRRDGVWIRMRLPSGRYLCYLNPEIDKGGSIRFWGVDQYTRRWKKLYTYGGKLAENATQAMSRDIMAYHMPNLEAAGYPIVLTVHDEPIAETPDTEDYTAEEMCRIMTAPIPWAPGLPLAAGGFETYRYRKE